MKTTFFRIIFCCITGLLCGLPALAHELRPTIVTVDFKNARQFNLEVQLNIEALIAGISPKHRDTEASPEADQYRQLRGLSPTELQQRFTAFLPRYHAGIEVHLDNQRVIPQLITINIPEIGDTQRARISRLLLQGSLPANARVFTWRYSAAFGDSVVRFPVEKPDTQGNVTAIYLQDGAKSDPYLLGEGFKSQNRWSLAGRYISLGFTHILPLGLDHILFVLGLFLLSARYKLLLWQVTAFTLAHSITLGLSMYGILSLPASVVEPLIALSIVYVAVENMLTTRLHTWRVVIVFLFGLLHGLGFAGVLNEVGLPQGEFILGLLTFNLGVELGQLAVILLGYIFVGKWFSQKRGYRTHVVIPASAGIALIGVYWTIERLV